MSVRPFHETIIDAVKKLSHRHEIGKLKSLAELTLNTEIPQNHDAIAIVFEDKFDELGCVDTTSLVQHLDREKARHGTRIVTPEDFFGKESGVNRK